MQLSRGKMLYLRAGIRDGEMAFTLYGADGAPPPETFGTLAEVMTAVSAIAARKSHQFRRKGSGVFSAIS
jgi:hypothetical protein